MVLGACCFRYTDKRRTQKRYLADRSQEDLRLERLLCLSLRQVSLRDRVMLSKQNEGPCCASSLAGLLAYAPAVQWYRAVPHTCMVLEYSYRRRVTLCRGWCLSWPSIARYSSLAGPLRVRPVRPATARSDQPPAALARRAGAGHLPRADAAGASRWRSCRARGRCATPVAWTAQSRYRSCA